MFRYRCAKICNAFFPLWFALATTAAAKTTRELQQHACCIFWPGLVVAAVVNSGEGGADGYGDPAPPCTPFLVGSMRCSTEIIFSPSCMFRFWFCFVFGFLGFWFWVFLCSYNATYQIFRS